MKKCIHCGVSIKGNAAAFCPRCKKPLKKKRSVPAKPKKSPQSIKRPSNRKSKPLPLKNIMVRFRIWLSDILKSKENRKPDVEPVAVINPMDENYDGYYDDKPTDDNEQNRETFEPELIKRIAFISGGAVVIIILAIILLNLL